MTTDFAGSESLNQLNLEPQGVGAACVYTRIPPTRRPSVRSWNSSPPLVDGYGFRGSDPRVHLLSPFEFFMYWKIEAVLPPMAAKCGGRTVWCPGREAHYQAHKHDAGFKLRPGTDYRIAETSDEFIVFPDIKVLQSFRHCWVLVRNARPMVPVFTRSKLPRPGLSAEENARLCSVYFRPWTLCRDLATLDAPHLLHLAMYPRVVGTSAQSSTHLDAPKVDTKKLRLNTKTPPMCNPSERVEASTDAHAWASSWRRYKDGQIVSEHARRLIQNFLTMTLARTAADEDTAN